MLKPNNSWMWYYDPQNDSLMLDLGNEMVFRVSIPTKHLVTSAYDRTVFTVDDASVYQAFKEGIAHLELSEPRKAELALNAVAASRFHKPMMPKSWFFETLQGGCEPENGDICTIIDFHMYRLFAFEFYRSIFNGCLVEGNWGRRTHDLEEPVTFLSRSLSFFINT